MDNRVWGWLGVVTLAVGVCLFVGSGIDNVVMRWVQYPEATDRLLWTAHTGRCLLQTAGYVAGLVLGFLGWVLASENLSARR